MAIPKFIRQILNTRLGDVAFKARLGDQIYALQKGFTEGEVDPDTGTDVPLGLGFSSDSVYGFAVGTTTGTIATAGTAVACTAVAWPQLPKMWSVAGPVGASVAIPTYTSGEVTFTVNASATGAVTVYFS